MVPGLVRAEDAAMQSPPAAQQYKQAKPAHIQDRKHTKPVEVLRVDVGVVEYARL